MICITMGGDMEQSKLIVDLPEPLRLRIVKIADEENKSAEEVIIELLKDVLYPASQVPPQVIPGSPGSTNSRDE